MATDGGSARDVEFLQQQVQRLNAVLNQYQNKCQPRGPQDEQAVPLLSQGPHASWLTDRRLLTPLLTEYDNIISQLQHNISTFQTEITSLNARVEQVTSENARLYQELRESVETQLIKEGKKDVEETEGTRKSSALGALQNQLAAISKDRDNYREKLRQTAFELEHLQKSDLEKNRLLEKYKVDLSTAQHTGLSLRQKVEELQTACVKLNEERGVCVESAQAGEREVEQLSQALSDTRSEFKALQMRNTELLRAHNELALQMRKREAENDVMDGQGKRTDGRVHLLELAKTELEGKLVAALSDVSVLSKEKAELEEGLAVQQSRLAGLEREVHAAVAHVKESMEMVESAILDKDQAVIVSQQKTQEAETLRVAMDTLLQEAGQRTCQEVDAVRAEYNRNIDQMAEEIQKLEEECGKKQALLERAQRQKKTVESELGRVQERLPVEAARTGEALLQLQNRVCEAERAREEAHRKMEDALIAQRVAAASLAEEKSHREEVCSELRRKVKEEQEEGERVRAERAQFVAQLQEMREQLRTESQAREEAERRAKQELAAVSQHYEARERELQYRLQGREQSTAELRELLTSQYHMGTRWREESKTLSLKFEETINSLRNEVSEYRRKYETLKIEMDTLMKQQSQQMQRLQANKSHLQQQLKSIETRAEAATAQVSSLLLREKQLLADRRELQRQLDKLKLEIARRAGMALAVPGLSIPPTPGPLPTTNFPPTPLDTSSTPLNVTGFGQALSGLQQSIRQVRQELELTQAQDDHTPAPRASRKRSSTRHTPKSTAIPPGSSSPENSLVSEHSSLHRADLSPHSHISNTLPHET